MISLGKELARIAAQRKSQAPKEFTYGMVQGNLTILDRTHETNDRNERMFKCKCNCGKVVMYGPSKLRTGIKSCGCLSRNIEYYRTGTQHGDSGTKFHTAWTNMIERNKNKEGKRHEIEERLRNYLTFKELMYPTYVDGYRLMRIDNQKGFYVGNLEWRPFGKRNVK